MQFAVCESYAGMERGQRAPQTGWGQSVVTNHVNIVTKIQNGFLTCPEFSPSTSHHSFFLFVSFNFSTCPGYNIF